MGCVKAGLKKHSGFTLFELIISLTIVSVMLVLVFGALRLGVKAWDRGEQDLVVDQQERIVLEMLKRQIASFRIVEQSADVNETSTVDLETGLDENTVILEGDEKNLKFFSTVSLVPGRTYGPVFARYVVVSEDDRESLFLYEKNSVLLELEDKLSDSEDTQSLVPLITDMEQIFFEYLKKNDSDSADPTDTAEEPPEWQSQWNPEEDEGFPAAVKVSVVDPRSQSQVAIVARIRIDNED